MSRRMRDTLMQGLGHLRHEPTEKRIRATIDTQVVVDSTRAMLVWEPRRVVPAYAVPAADVHADLVPSAANQDLRSDDDAPAGPPVLHPGIPFAAHSTAGGALDLHVGDAVRPQAAFRLADADLAGYVLLDFRAFDAWSEEEEMIFSHPRDPFHRIDILRSSRPVQIELEGHVLAESTQPTLLFETNLPVRFYLPRADVTADLKPSAKRTECPYKGAASYWSFDIGSEAGRDVAWSYEAPVREAADVTGLVAFFDERVDVIVDGTPRERPRTQWSPGP